MGSIGVSRRITDRVAVEQPVIHFETKFYNFDVDIDDHVDHAVVAQGLVNGSISLEEVTVRDPIDTFFARR